MSKLWPHSNDFDIHLTGDIIDCYLNLQELCPDHPLLQYLTKVTDSGFKAHYSFGRVYGKNINFRNEHWFNTNSLTKYFDDLVDVVDSFYK